MGSAAWEKRVGLASWQRALVAFVILGSLSEAAYLGLGLLAKTCLLPGGSCGQVAHGVSQTLFAAWDGADGRPQISNILAFGLPGLNNLFYALLVPTASDEVLKFAQTIAISLIVGFMMTFGFMATANGRSLPARLLLAVVFALGWSVLYNGAEMSIYGLGGTSIIALRWLEVPVTVLALTCLIPFVRRRDA